MQHMKDVYSFTPSKRAYQTQFKRWGFPSKQHPAHRNAELVSKVHELWERNTSQRDMLKTLNDQGFEIKERELMRVRAKNRWLLRVPNGMKSNGSTESITLNHTDQGNHELLAFQNELIDSAATSTPESTDNGARRTSSASNVVPDAAQKRKERHAKMQAESDERWAAKKRRRRTRGWAGLPADPPGPPRFPSETTIDESKTLLSLDNQLYRQLRDHFQRICEDIGLVKKTLAGPEKWQIAKDRLVQVSPHLQNIFWTQTAQRDAKALALDVICTDVTKRMRTMERRMTIAEAKNILGVNPEQSRHLRNAFYGTLTADRFTSKLEAGDEHWQELKKLWIQGSPLLLSILASGETDPEHANKLKAVEVLCRDVMKRLRDDRTKRDSLRNDDVNLDGQDSTVEVTEGAIPTEQQAAPGLNSSGNKSAIGDPNNDVGHGISTLASKALAHSPMVTSNITEFQIDPSLLQAANDRSLAADHTRVTQDFRPSSIEVSMATPVAIYVRPHPKSQIYQMSKMWLGSLSTRAVVELRHLLTSKWPDAAIVRIDGVERGSNGQDISYLIEEDEELDAYLTHVQDRKATFVALIHQR